MAADLLALSWAVAAWWMAWSCQRDRPNYTHRHFDALATS